jgi:hypothetical protein
MTRLLFFLLLFSSTSLYAQREVHLDTNFVTTSEAIIRIKTLEISETVTVWKPDPNHNWIQIHNKNYQNPGWHIISIPVEKGWNDITVCMVGGIERKFRIFKF